MIRSQVAVLVVLVAVATSARAQDAPDRCGPGQDDPAERPAPDALLPRLGRTFGVAPDVLRGTSFVRCAGGALLACEVGANLTCGQADVRRRSQGGDAFCHDSPNADTVPLAAVGHDTVYEWHCEGTRAVAGRMVEKVDRLGFMAGNWRAMR